MSAHPAPRATPVIRAETAGSSGLALGPNQRGKATGEAEASIPVMAMVYQRIRGRAAGGCLGQPTALVKTRLRRMQCRPGLIEGFLAGTRLDFTPFCNPRN
jgi:hypothetical protein